MADILMRPGVTVVDLVDLVVAAATSAAPVALEIGEMVQINQQQQ